ncbi:YhcN/YlaJ family sporulation lipoprotein [Lysinibacillus sp. NPDC097287]|uniref:YhcN/YlaJ family sporulation lipoprotein n=1 Tax=Lysinibacillus sp. NPDC097287 TaxID=3364144 RepID=UPI00381B522D
MRQLQTVLLLLLSIFILSGCTEKEKFIVYGSPHNEEELESVLKEEDYVEKSTVIQHDDKMLVAVQIKPWDKWKKAKLEKKLQKKFDELYPHKEVFVSADYKIYYEANKAKKDKLEDKKISDKIKELKKLAKEKA